MSAAARDEAIYEDFVSQLLAEQLTVTLIPKVESDLQKLRDRTNLSRTDITNRAITLYEFIDAQLRTGNDIQIRNRQTGEIRQVRIA
jgi:hypothetical protein